MKKEINEHSMCFACSKANPISLKLEFYFCHKNKIRAEFVPETCHQGYNNIMHGGLISTLLDEAMVKLLYMKGIKALTFELIVRFKNPIQIGKKLLVYGLLKSRHGKLFFTEAYLTDKTKKIFARGEGKFITV